MCYEMNNKFNLTREQNVFIAKRNIVDYIWKSANLEGIGVTYPETQAIYDGGVVNGLTVDNWKEHVDMSVLDEAYSLYDLYTGPIDE